MKRIIRIYITLGLAVLMASCGKDLKDLEVKGFEVEYEAVKSELDVSESSWSIDASEQMLKIKIICNSYWTATTNTAWLYLQNDEGKGNGTLSIKANSNSSTTDNRTGDVTVTDGIKTITIVVTQAPAAELLNLSESSLSFKYSGGFINVYVESNSSWAATSDASWCKVSSYSSRFSVSVESNDSYSPRTATITVSGSSISQTVKVSQEAASEPIIGDLSVSNVTKTSADCKFTYKSSDLSIQIRGICYSTTNREPTRNDVCQSYNSYSNSGTSSHSLTSLNQNTTYYVRPYVTTSIGTTYGKVVQFTTAKSNSPEEDDNPTPGY